MMESCFNNQTDDSMDPLSLEGVKKDLSEEFLSMSVLSQDPSLQEKEHLHVYLRIRPFTAAEKDNDESQECVTIENSDTVLLKAPRSSLSARLSDKSLQQTAQRFQFSKVYGPQMTQKDIFNGTVKPLVKDVLEGGNSLVFTYGVTNAGKTFTFLGPDNDTGILPRSLNMIFNNIQDKIYTQMDIKPHRCREYTRLTKDQQVEEHASKKAILRFTKENDSQKSTSIQSNSDNRSNLLEGTTINGLDVDESLDSESFTLNLGDHTKFSIWVSFCEIYNESIYDLLESIPTGSLRRNTLRLAQDVKGHTYVKDLKWVQVNDADEAYKVLKLGKKHQSFSCTKLNHLSSRSHSIFSIRIIRIEDVGIPRVQKISELSLCDLAGSERCAKTQNKGDRLKEAGNINTSLLILGKCLTALRYNQQAKLPQHVPFRESKLTHYLQGFFCGRGRACMIVNINQCASMFDETLNVLKFSALAQKVVVLTTTKPPSVAKKSAREVSFIINNADRKHWRKRESSFISWDTSLEDVQEDDDDDEEDESMEETIQDEDEEDAIQVNKELYEKQITLIEDLKNKVLEEKADKLLLESRIREEVSKEFTELFSQMESDFSERLEKEKEIIEERAERRMEIFRNLVRQKPDEEAAGGNEARLSSEHKLVMLDGMVDAMQDDLAGIKKDAQAAQDCLVSLTDPKETITSLENQLSNLSEDLKKTQELLTLKTTECETAIRNQMEENGQLIAARTKLESQNEKLQCLMEFCQEKDDMISKLQNELDHWEETATKDKTMIEAIKGEILHLKTNCTCSSGNDRDAHRDSRKRGGDIQQNLEGQPPLKKGANDEERDCIMIPKKDELQAELNKKHLEVVELKENVEHLQQELKSVATNFQNEIRLKDELIGQIKEALSSSERKVKELSDELKQQALSYENTLKALEDHSKENQKTVEQNEKLVKEMSRLQKDAEENALKIKQVEDALNKEREQVEKASAELKATKDLLMKHEADSQETSQMIGTLRNRVELLTQQLEESQDLAAKRDSSHFHETIESLHKECEKVVKESAQKSQQILHLEQEINSLKQQMAEQKELSTQLTQELSGLQSACSELMEKETLINQLRERLETLSKDLESERQVVTEKKKVQSNLENEVVHLKGIIKNFEEQGQISKSSFDKVVELEQQLAGKESLMENLQNCLKETQCKLEDLESNSSLQEAKLSEAEQSLKTANETIAGKDAELKNQKLELLRLKEQVNDGLQKIQSLSLDFQRKEEDASDLKEKLVDSKKQIQQVQREISSMREEERILKQKLNDLEKVKNQMIKDLSSKDRTIHQLKSEQSNRLKSDESVQLYQKTLKDLQAKDQVIEDMRLALTEQEETQVEQDRVLEAKLEEIEALTAEKQMLKQKLLNPTMGTVKEDQMMEESINGQSERARREVDNLKEILKLSEEKHQADRRKWQEERLTLIKQAKEAEVRRHNDMKKYAEDRERHSKMQTEVENLTKQLSEKDGDLQKWRKERDDLVAALEVQLKSLRTANLQKDKELENLRQDLNARPREEDNHAKNEQLQRTLLEKESDISKLKEQLKTLTETNLKVQVEAKEEKILYKEEENPSKNNAGLVQKIQDENKDTSIKDNTRSSTESKGIGNNQSVLDSSGISTENGRTSRFPKPELEIQFTPLRPNKMEVKMQGEASPVTIKIPRTRKRKSNEMEKNYLLSGCWKNKTKLKAKHENISQDFVESENRMNIRSRTASRNIKEQSPASLRRQASRTSLKSENRKKDGPLQKIGDFIQSSPNLLQSKAKKFIGSLNAKSPEPLNGKGIDSKPKKSKRKLYKTEISSPLDIPSHPIVGLDQDEKESDHLIIKRRLRSRTARR
ncbi:kinesin-like protein KIF20B isoform X3 [Amia ocellicauda]|uniref:kinesin-like protein KIF20B isoform X3 n=1 Tax=Amia ocellicauda TaxID=2972642 RepID=UPI00346484A7